MDFSLTAEQELLVTSVLRLGATKIAPSARTAHMEISASLKNDLVELGLLSILAPAELDGAGLSPVELVLVTEALAQADAGVALCVGLHNVLGPGLAWPNALRRAMLHEAVAGNFAGDDRSALALSSALVVATRGSELVLLRDVTHAWAPRLGLSSAGFARCDGGEVVATLPTSPHVWSYTTLVAAAAAVGVARQALAKARVYANERKQFGKSIGEFQGVQWKLADSATELHAAWLLVLRAAATLRGTDVAMAKLLASDAAMHATDHALQIHGGYGYVEEFDVERLYRDAKSLMVLGGSPETHKATVGRKVSA